MKKPHIISKVLAGAGCSLLIISLIIVGVTDKDSFIEYTSSSGKYLTNSMKDSSKTSSKSKIKEISYTEDEKDEIEIAEAIAGDVYSGETQDEIAAKLNRHLGNDLLGGKGELIASYSMSLGVDPYLAAAVMLHESACGSHCSSLARNCHNFAGQKGANKCSGDYVGYATVDDGIKGAINNLYKNYYSKGLNRAESIGTKYAASNTWVSKINYYIRKLKG